LKRASPEIRARCNQALCRRGRARTPGRCSRIAEAAGCGGGEGQGGECQAWTMLYTCYHTTAPLGAEHPHITHLSFLLEWPGSCSPLRNKLRLLTQPHQTAAAVTSQPSPCPWFPA
jgi:hypothetical protein